MMVLLAYNDGIQKRPRLLPSRSQVWGKVQELTEDSLAKTTPSGRREVLKVIDADLREEVQHSREQRWSKTTTQGIAQSSSATC